MQKVRNRRRVDDVAQHEGEIVVVQIATTQQVFESDGGHIGLLLERGDRQCVRDTVDVARGITGEKPVAGVAHVSRNTSSVRL